MDHASHQKRVTYSQTLIDALSGFPDRIALADESGQLTYRELSERISQTTQALLDLGLRPGDGIAQLSPNCMAAAIVQLSAYALGLRYTPLHPLGALEDHAYILNDAAVKAFVFEPHHFETVAMELTRRCPRLAIVLSHRPTSFSMDLSSAASRFKPTPLSAHGGPDDIVNILYTGGTSGRPKGVTLSSWSMVMNVLLTLAGWEWPGEIRFLCSTPITHATGCMLIPILSRGGTMVLQQGFSVDRFLDAVERYAITTTFLVPTMIYALTARQKTRCADTSSLISVFYGAAPITAAGLEAALDTFGPVFMQIYSQSEAPCCATVLRKEEHIASIKNRLSSCGRPMPGINVAILDDNDEVAAIGQIGEVCFQGPSIMEGYWNKPDETAKALANGWLRTGDLAYRDSDGFIYIVDRRKEMIVSGGFNVYPREVEDALSWHPAVHAVAVIGVPDEKWGEAVKAVIVRREGCHATEQELIAFARDKKGPVSAPKSIDFVDELPLTSLGKPDKKILRAKFWGIRERQVN